MTTASDFELEGHHGRIVGRRWSGDAPPRFVVLLAHGYGEHAGRYQHVADRLVAIGADVYAPDHRGHGRSTGEPALVPDMDEVTNDLHLVADLARDEHPGLPLVLVGHSMGGLIATRFAQLFGDELAALVLSGPAIGTNDGLEFLLSLDEIPDIPIDPTILSRDPAVGEAYAADPLVYHGPFRKETVQAFVDGIGAVGFGPGFGALPTLWIHGTNDQLVPYEPVAATMEQLRGDAFEQVAYDGAAHEVFNETNRDQVLDDVVAFLERHV